MNDKVDSLDGTTDPGSRRAALAFLAPTKAAMI